LLDTLTRLREEGKVLHLSVNSFDVNVIEHVMTLPVFGAMMIDYNILRPEREPIVAKLAALNFGIMAGMALGGGCIEGTGFAFAAQDAWYIARAWKIIVPISGGGRNLHFLAKEQRLTAPEIALAWVLRKPEIGCAVPGTTRMSHLLANLKISGETLDDDLLQRISKAQLNFS